MSIPASIRRKYLSNFLAIVLAVTGLQAIAISSAPTASALTWTDVTGPTGRAKDWQHIRTNNDGSVIGVVSLGAIQSNLGDLYLSRDSGASWTYTSQPTNNYYGLYRLAISGNGNIAIAADDSYIVKATYSGSAWSYSTRTWSSAGSGTNQRCAGYGPNFNSFAASTDGSNWVAGARDEGCVYTSSNSGVDWSNSNVGGTHFGSAISADGTVRVTSNSNGSLYRNSGSGWSAITTSGLPSSTGWSGIACDSTCTKMAIFTYGGKIYTTSNSGANWSAGGSANRNTVDLSMSLDGSVIAITDGAEIYISKDLGATWSGEGQAGKTWTGVTVSGDGKKIYAAASDGTIRKADIAPTITVACSGGGSFSVENNVVTTSTLDCAGAVVIPDGVTSIAANAFSRFGKTTQEQQRITSVTFPNSVITIGTGAFQDNRNVSSLTIGSAVTTIGNDAFNNLYAMTTLVIPGSVTTIGARAFANVNLTSLTLNEGLVTIGNSAFLGNKLVTLVIPNSVTTISSEAAFAGWELIETLTLGSGLTTIGSRTFEGVKRLQSLTIPPGVTTLGTNAFRDYPQSTYKYCGTSLTQTVLDSAGLAGKTKTCQVAQTSALTVTSTIATYGSTLTLTTTGGNGSGSISFVVDSGPCTVVGSNLYSSNVGTCMVTATKAASSNYLAASSTSTAITVNRGTPTISLALPASATTATYGTAVTITATVSKSGKVTFKSGGTAITGCTLVSGSTTATCNWTPSAVNASTSLTADFAPDDSTKWENLTAAGLKTINVGKATQAVIISATSTNFNLGVSDTLTATVSAGATGTATFNAGGNALCTTGSLSEAGAAQCAWTPTVAGTYSVTATYSGDSNYATGTSSSSSIVVNSVITYDVNGATGNAPSAFTSPGTSTTLPLGTGLSKSGYTFGGWSTTSSGSAVSSTYSSTISRTLYAVWTANQYVITYLANSGSGTQTAGSYTTGATATTLPATTTFTRTGYTFGGWATSATSTAPVTSYSTSANVSFYAIWIHGTYTVTYNANGGSGTMAAQTSNATANLNGNTFTYTDREFNSWNTSADGTGIVYSNSVSYPFLANITLYAQWGNVITFSSQGATSGTPSQTSRSWSNGAINLPQVGTMVKAGYTFGGWSNGTTTYAGGASYTPTGGITLNPVWTANTYTISFNSNSATSGNVPANQSWTSGNTARTLSGNIGSPVLAKSGYTFGGWATTASSTTRVATYSSFANQTFYAIWTPISYTITYALNGGTSPLPTQASKNIYNTFSLAGTPTKADFYFAGWSDGTTTYGALATYTITANSPTAITLTAQWIPIYTVSYVLNGSSSSVTGEGSYTSGTVVTLSTTPVRTGYTFNNWLDSSNVTHAAGSSFTVLQNSVLQAQWTAVLYPVTYALNGASGTLPLQSSLAMNSPFVISSTEPVRAGYAFGGWSDSTSVYPAGSTYVIGTSSVTLTAQWLAIPYSVTYDLGGGQGTLPTQADGLIGSTFTLPASSANPTWIAHTFTGWSDGAAVYAAGATYTFGASNVTLTAQYSLNGYTQITYSLGASGAGALPASTSALEGNTITVASGAGVTRSNYAFAGWTDGSNLYQPGDIYLVGPEAAPVTFVPSWTSGYNVAYSTGSGFGIAPIDTVGRITGATFSVASAATLSRQGFTFTGWSDGTNVVQPGATYTVGSANITLTAQWVQNSLAGIASSALTPLASFSIVNGVGPSGSFNFGSTTISYVIPVNALSPGTTVSIYGLTDTSSISGVLPTGKVIVSSTVISWLSTDGTVPDTSSPIAMTITNSDIVPGTVVYAITGSSIVSLGTATSNGSITTSITSDPVIILANPVVVAPVVLPSNSGGDVRVSVTPTPDPTVLAALAAEKAAAEKAAAEAIAAAAAKAAADKKAADEAELAAIIKALQEQAAAEAAALAAAKKAADELRIAEELRIAQEKADAALKAAAEKKALEDAAAAALLAAKKIVPQVSLYTVSSKLKLSAYDTAYLKKYISQLAPTAKVTCVGYIYSKNTTYAKAKALAQSQAKAVCALIKKEKKTITTATVLYPASKAPKAAAGSKYVAVSYRIDSFKK
jgi:uncharacterized repeat protein (TIGR02543 family)